MGGGSGRVLGHYEPTETLVAAAPDRRTLSHIDRQSVRCQPLVVPLAMIVRDKFRDRLSMMALAKWHHAVQTFLSHEQRRRPTRGQSERDVLNGCFPRGGRRRRRERQRPRRRIDRRGCPRRLLAFTELKFSNSMIEAWWRSLKHQWLFLHPLDSVATIRRLVAFYVHEHNQVLPHSAFRGQTPDEMYLPVPGTGCRQI